MTSAMPGASEAILAVAFLFGSWSPCEQSLFYEFAPSRFFAPSREVSRVHVVTHVSHAREQEASACRLMRCVSTWALSSRVSELVENVKGYPICSCERCATNDPRESQSLGAYAHRRVTVKTRPWE